MWDIIFCSLSISLVYETTKKSNSSGFFKNFFYM
jgi:hypothetical protein